MPQLPLPWTTGTHMSKETFEYHYAKHHQTYVTNLNNLIKGTEYESLDPKPLLKGLRLAVLQQLGAGVEPHLFLEPSETQWRRRPERRAGGCDQRQMGFH